MDLGKEGLKGLILGVGVYVANIFVGPAIAGVVGAQYAIVPLTAVGYLVVRAVKADSKVG